MTKRLFALLMMLVLILAACASKETDDGTLALLDMPYKLIDASRVTVSHFDFGEGDLRNVLGNPVPCPLAGIIAAPDGTGPYPLVFIFHGLKNVEDIYDPVYLGFDYLVRQLAAEGYVAVSINVNIEYHCWDYGEPIPVYDWAYQVYAQNMALLERANAGLESDHGIDLRGKIDFDQIHLMGHSRGGEMIDMFYRYEQDEGKNRIRSLLHIAPGFLPENEPHPDVPTGIILGEYDGDVREDGQLLYDTVRKQPERTAPVSFVWLRGANHAFFNREFTWDDAGNDKRPQEKRLTREQQEDFMMHYAAAFLSVFSKGSEPFGTWNPLEPQPVTMFGYAVTASSCIPGGQVYAALNETDWNIDTNDAVSYDRIIKTFDDDILFKHPGANMNIGTLELYSIRWTESGGAVYFPAGDFSSYNALTLYIAVDSSDDLNPKGEDQSFTVMLSDANGAVQSVLVPKGTSALAWYDGSELLIEEWDGSTTRIWDGFMPLGGLRIPLALFDKVDLALVYEIALIFDQTSSGAVMLSGIYLEDCFP